MNKYKERVQHGTGMFPLGVYRLILKDNIIHHHWHNEVEFIIVEEGEAVIQINSTFYNLTRDQGLIVNSGSIHCCIPANSSSCIISAIVFDIGMLNSRDEDIFQVKYMNPLINNTISFIELLDGKSEWSIDTVKCIKTAINNYVEKKQGFELYIKALLLKIVYNLISNNRLVQTKSIRNKDNKDLKKVLNYIWKNYNKNIELSSMAQAVNFSKYYFCRFFKSQIGKSPIEYLNSYRIEKAARLLADTNKQISEIATEVGFDNTSYFIRTFKRFKKCTPSDFRKLNPYDKGKKN